MTTSASYPSRAAQALGILKSHSNDLDIFVEDTVRSNAWLKFLRRYLPEGVRLNSVNPLGGRKEVLNACKSDQKIRNRARLYIIDSDFDFLLGKKKPNMNHLYRLRRYCFENYLLDQSSIEEAITTLNSSASYDSVNQKININAWLYKNENMLKSLFICYAVYQKLEIKEKTVSYSCYNLKNSDNNYCIKKVKKRIFHLYKKAINEKGQKKVRVIYDLVKNNSENMSASDVCSAKDYIIPLIHELSKDSFKMACSRKDFVNALSTFANTNIDPYLKRRLARLVK